MTVVANGSVLAERSGSIADLAIRELLSATGVDESVPAVAAAVATIRRQISELTLAQHEITEALITTQDQLSTLRTLTRVNVNSLGRAEAEVQMLQEAITLTNSDTVVLVEPESFQFVGMQSRAAELVIVARSGIEDAAPSSQVKLDGSSVVTRLAGTSVPTALAFARAAGPPFSTGDLLLIQAVVSSMEMMHTLTRLHLEAVQRSAMEREHQAASTLAQALLSTPVPELPGLKIFASSIPASVAGGDFVVLAEVHGVLWFAVGDVAGKGLPAAIVMTKAVSAARVAFLTQAADDPAAALSAVADELYEYLDDVGLFVTMVLGSYQPASRGLRLCNAGHSPVMTVRGGEVVSVPASTPPLGVVSSPTVGNVTFTLNPGDALVLGSDGLAEQQDPSGELLGYEKLIRLCREGPTDAPELGRRILNAVAAHAAGTPASDDSTLVVLSAEPAKIA